MKKLFTVFVLAAAVFAGSNAQAQFEKGDKLLNVGIGGGGYGFYSGGIAIGGSFEAGIHDFISIGAQADFRFYNYGYLLGPRSSYISIPLAARGSYHFGKHFLKIDELDLYGGLAAGFNIDNNEYFTNTPLVIGVHAGGRYYFKEKLGVFAEFAGGTNVIPAKVGLTLKF